jgi:stearoyl-CoA desaturase (Delta-9 desaturase)
LRALQAVGLIWDLKGVPNHIKYSKNKEHARELRKQHDAQKQDNEKALEEQAA